MLILKNLNKAYENVRAVKNISLEINRGEVYGFLGPNGAGKTTTIRMIMGIIQPDSGSIKLDGKDINLNGRKNLGYLPEDRGLYQKQKLAETINYFGLLKGLESTYIRKNTSFWLERFNLLDQSERKIEELSKGNQQKIQFILALLHNPDLLILDEPFTGLDPLNQLLLKEIIEDKSKDGKTIVFSTHQMEQVERLCSNICLINNGEIVLEGDLENIRNKKKTNEVEVVFSGNLNGFKIDDYFKDYKINENKISGSLKVDSKEFINSINNFIMIHSFKLKVPTLEQIFIQEVSTS